MATQHDNANPDLLRRIPLSARSVLDVGCSTGALGRAFRALSPNARLFGIEIDPAAAAVAAERLDAVAVVDVEHDPLPFADLPEVDCIVYGSVLEQLRDPWALVRRQAARLSEDGTVLLCVPNVEHWRFVERLLRGGWKYEEDGLFDRAHLRWFSGDSILQGLTEAGLFPSDAHPRVFESPAAGAFMAAIEPTLKAMGVDPAEYVRRAMPLQYVWRARKSPPRPLVIGASMLAPVGGVSHVRVLYPLSALATTPGVIAEVGLPMDARPADPETPRIFVLHRPILSGEPGLGTIRKLLRGGWVIVTEFDDHPDYFPAPDPDAQYAFGGVHAVQTSTPALAELLRTRNPEVRVFPNAVRRLPEVRNFADPASMTLFFGALNRERDWQPLMPVLNEVAAAAGGRLKFTVAHDRAFFEALGTAAKTFVPTCDYPAYLDLLAGSEISFMPLSDDPFNRAKSDLKFIEAGACRVAALASDVVYADSIEDGKTGVLFRNADELRDRLYRLLDAPERARAIGDAARAYVARERMLADQVATRLAWYRELWARRDELTARLLERLTAIRLGMR